MNTVDILGKAGVVPVIVIDKVEQAVPLAKALVRGGLPVLEVTFRTEAAAGAIAAIRAASEDADERFAADFLFVAGDDVPNRGGHLVGFPKDFNWYLPPHGYSWDICSREAFKSVVRKGDKYLSPGGTEYAAVVTNPMEKATLPCGPDFICLKAPGGIENEVRFIHRIYDDSTDAYFVAQPIAPFDISIWKFLFIAEILIFFNLSIS